MDAQDLMVALPVVAPPLLRTVWRDDSCIASTRVATAVCRYFGVTAKPVEVETGAWNRLCAEAIDAGATPDWAGGAWSVGVVRTEGPISSTSWPGAHLVAEVVDGDDCWILDLAARQFARPNKEIIVPDGLALAAPSGWDHVTFRAESTGTVLDYTRCDRVTPFRHTPDWKKAHRWKPIVGDIIRTLKTLEAT